MRDAQSTLTRLNDRRRNLGMSTAALASRSGVSEPTVKRILAGRSIHASFVNVTAIAQALGSSLTLEWTDPDDLRRRQARLKAEHIARLVQGNSALEAQAVDRAHYQHLVDATYHELLAGSRRRLWSE